MSVIQNKDEKQRKEELLKELLRDFKDAGAKDKEIPALEQVVKILMNDVNAKIPSHLIDEIIRKSRKESSFRKSKIFLFRTAAAAVFLIFIAGLFLLPDINPSGVNVPVVADENLEKIDVNNILIKYSDDQEFIIANDYNLDEVYFSVVDKNASISLSKSQILAHPGTFLSFADSHLAIKRGEVVINTGSKSLNIVSEQFITKINPNSTILIEVYPMREIININKVTNKSGSVYVMEIQNAKIATVEKNMRKQISNFDVEKENYENIKDEKINVFVQAKNEEEFINACNDALRSVNGEIYQKLDNNITRNLLRSNSSVRNKPQKPTTNLLVQMMVLSGNAVVNFKNKKKYNLGFSFDELMILYEEGGNFPTVRPQSNDDIVKNFKEVFSNTVKLAKELGNQDVIKRIPKKPSIAFTAEFLKEINFGKLLLVKRITSTKEGSEVAIFEFDGEKIYLDKGDKLAGWTLGEITDKGCTFTKDDNKKFIPLK